MLDNKDHNPSMGETAARFLARLSPGDREASQPEVHKFARWYGWERPFGDLSAPDVASFAEQQSLSDTDYAHKLELIRAFLTHARKEGWSRTNLATHLKAKKTKAGPVFLSTPLPKSCVSNLRRYHHRRPSSPNRSQQPPGSFRIPSNSVSGAASLPPSQSARPRYSR